MKRLTVLLLLIVYGFSSSGMTLHFHYCCGKLDKIELSPAKEMKCGMQHKAEKKSCCDSKQLELKVKSDYKAEAAAKLIIPSFSAAKSFTDFAVTQPRYGKQLIPQVFAPPPLYQNPLYIFHCLYRI